jgi:uncharacterized protein (DUF1330 family)
MRCAGLVSFPDLIAEKHHFDVDQEKRVEQAKRYHSGGNMTAYAIADFEWRNREALASYVDGVRTLLPQFGGQILSVAGEAAPAGPIEVLEGNWNPRMFVLIRFKSAEIGKQFFASEDYRPLRELRRRSALSRIIVVNGIEPTVRSEEEKA